MCDNKVRIIQYGFTRGRSTQKEDKDIAGESIYFLNAQISYQGSHLFENIGAILKFVIFNSKISLHIFYFI